jgi:GxxExxY protein
MDHEGHEGTRRKPSTQVDHSEGDEATSRQILTCAMRVHSALGPGLLESAYEICLAHVLEASGVPVKRQVSMPLTFEGVDLDAGYRLDLLVDNRVVVEVKAIERLQPIHTAQLLSYLRLANLRMGLLLNFHVLRMKDGIKRVLNG